MQTKFNDKKKIRRFVLIVEDEFINREVLGNILKEEYNILYAVNGREGLEIIRENASMISVILLDIMMPEMNGFELMEILQADEKLKHIPIIVLTAEGDSEVKCLTLGAADFIKKPYGLPEVIRARVMRTIELSEDRNFIYSAERDELTNLYSQAFFYEYAEMMDKYNPELKTDAVILNVEHFHLVNEIHGRNFGDQVLQVIGDVIREFLSGKEGLACRSEADTFFIYLEHHENYEELVQMVNGALSELSKSLHLRLRIGVYAKVEREILMEQRFSDARFACNTLRGNYMRDIAYYDMALRDRSIFMERLIGDMHEALEQKQFCVYYQPKYNIAGEEPFICSAEALVRWKHPKLGMIKPEVFLPVFEENGLISYLDHYVWREVAEQLGKWKKESDITVPVSVNVSRIDLYDRDLDEFLNDLLEENGLTQEQLLLEITESAYTSDTDQITEAVETLRENGFRIEMDDFGSGYSTLNVLTTMPVDVLKLDISFIRHIHEDQKALRMVKLIMDMAEFLEVPVIAEGVEIAAQYDYLKQMGCEIIQGYYFSKPLPAEEFAELYLDGIEQE
ncbi:MAG: EAL domain-containing protein [Lachnospiraceae bacterium]|nr:EAL domain-containing protein [Lachnospiraceae bacterium]